MNPHPSKQLPDLGDHNYRRVLTRAEAAKFLSVSIPTLERWARENSGPPHVRLGIRRLGYPLDKLIAFIESRQAA
jgi:predicted DNA-binding transcriptional regulator AlpA